MTNKDKELAKAAEAATPANVLGNMIDSAPAPELFNPADVTISMLTHVSAPTGNETKFKLDDALVSEIVGIIVSMDETQVMFGPDSVIGSGEKPLCSAVKQDGLPWHGVGIPGGDCTECEFKQFGSKGRGCACDHRRELFVITKEQPTVPIRISLSPTSQKNWTNYAFKLSGRGIKYPWQVWTSFTLTTAKGVAGMYGVIVPTMKAVLTQAELAEYGSTILQLQKMHLPQPAEMEDVFEE